MFKDLQNDVITLKKSDGEIISNLKANVQPELIFITTNTGKLVIDEGDIIERTLSNGKLETYEVIDPVFNESLLGLPANYQIKVRKTNQKEKINDNPSSITIKASQGAMVNINSSNNSFVCNNTNLKIFDELLKVAETISNNDLIVNSIKEMRESVDNKNSFAEKYKEFIQNSANHMTLFAPLLAELSCLL